jgi:hypothetical protein
MVTIQAAAVYSTGGAMAYELTYSEGTKVRAVETRDSMIRKECRAADGWKLVGKPYRVTHDAKRAAEQIKRQAQDFIAAQ